MGSAAVRAWCGGASASSATRVRQSLAAARSSWPSGRIRAGSASSPSAGGLVVERGSLLSHAAIVARELGLPAVIALPDATTRLVDGDLVEIDGTAGTVRVLTSADAETAEAGEAACAVERPYPTNTLKRYPR